MERGPIPERTSDLVGNHSAERANVTTARSGSDQPVSQPPPNPDWHPLAKSWYASFGASGQKVWYEPSDWMQLTLAAEQLSRELSEKVLSVTMHGEKVYGTGPITASTLSAVNSIAVRLLATEGDRRRMRIELTRGHEPKVADEVEARRKRREEMQRRAQGG